jgi:hypothetical protein
MKITREIKVSKGTKPGWWELTFLSPQGVPVKMVAKAVKEFHSERLNKEKK